MSMLFYVFMEVFIVYFSFKMAHSVARNSVPESFIIKLVKVPLELTLYDVINALKGDLKTILSCFRTYNYADQEVGEDLFVLIRDVFEYREIKEKDRIAIGNSDIKLEFYCWRFGAASSSLDAFIGPAIGPKPAALKLSNLTTVSRITTFYMMKLLSAFESFTKGDITGLTLLYDNFRHEIRPFGFIAFKSELSMMRFNLQSVRVYDEVLNCEASNRVPVLVNENNKALLDPFPVVLTKELCDANLLNNTPLARSESHMSLALGMGALNLNGTNYNNNEMLVDEIAIEVRNDISDTESILSLDVDYDFDEECNLVNKN